MTSVPAPRTSAPIVLRKFATSTMCGSLATFSRMVSPSASTAASIALMVAPTETVSKKMCSARQAVGLDLDGAVLDPELRPQRGKRFEVLIDRPRAEIAAAGHRDAAACQSGPATRRENSRRPASAGSSPRAPRWRRCGRYPPPAWTCRSCGSTPPIACRICTEVATSLMLGRFSITHFPPARMVAGRIATAAFFAPLTVTSPTSGLPPLITNFFNIQNSPFSGRYTLFSLFSFAELRQPPLSTEPVIL